MKYDFWWKPTYALKAGLRTIVFVAILEMLFISVAVAQMALLPKTGQTTSYASGDDGALQMGVAWPNPRFKDNNDGTITDNPIYLANSLIRKGFKIISYSRDAIIAGKR